MNETVEDVTLERRTRAQFGEMLAWSQRGWAPAPRGRVCPECRGVVWLKVLGRTERHCCTSCGWSKEYQV